MVTTRKAKRKIAPNPTGGTTNNNDDTDTETETANEATGKKRSRTTTQVKKKAKIIPKTTVVRVEQSFVANAIAYSRNQQVAKKLWESLDSNLQNNRDVAFAALKRGAITFTNLPSEIKGNRDFLMDGLQENMFPWKTLPRRFKEDVDFALKALDHPDTKIIVVIRWVTNKEKLWSEGALQIAKRTKSSNDYHLFDQAPASFKSNATIQLEIVSEQPRAAMFLGNDLKESYDFLQKLLKKNLLALPHLGSETYDRFPTIMNIESIATYLSTDGSEHNSLVNSVPAQSWKDRSFVEGWVSCGGTLTTRILSSFRDEEDIVLNYAKNPKLLVTINQYGNGFGHVSNRLLSDKAFVSRMIVSCKCPGKIFMSAPSKIKKDKDLLLLACSTHANYHPKHNTHSGYRYGYGYGYGNDERAQEFENWVKQCMKEYDGFFKGILCGTSPDSGSPLVGLDQGHDLKRNIASFLMFPQGEKLTMLLKTAAVNLKIRGYSNPYEDRR
jgi:hypothetical protein